MGRKRRNILDGFTLVELLVVIVVIAILISLAVPTYIRTTEKVRAGEAITNLELIYTGERVYRLQIGVYSPDLADADDINTALNIFIEPKDWSYDVDGSLSTTFTATATRGGSGAYSTDQIIIDEHGTWSGNSPFVPSN